MRGEKIPTFHRNTRIGNYLQNIEYFEPLKLNLQEFYKIWPHILEKVSEMIPSNSLCLHRRFFLPRHHANKCPSDEMVQNALDMFKYSGKKIFIFSNDIERSNASIQVNSATFVHPGKFSIDKT